MFRNKLFIILIILLIIAVVLVAVFWYLSRKSEEDGVTLPTDGNNNINLNTQLPSPQVTPPLSKPKISEQDKLKAQLTKMAAAFAERLGSYSNQSDFENLEDLMTFMSRDLKSWAENIIQTNRGQASQQTLYYGITTKALKTNLIEFSPASGQAKIKVSTQRHEIIGSSANARVYYQDLELEMIKQGGVWKVDKAEWQ